MNLPADASLLRSPICLHCNYALRGLGTTGMCPECGKPFDTSILSIEGTPSRRKRARTDAPMHTMPKLGLIFQTVVLGAIAIFAVSYIGGTGRGQPIMPIVATLFFGAIAVWHGYYVVMPFVRGRPNFRLILTPAGYAEASTLEANFTSQAWPADAMVTLELVGDLHRLRISPRTIPWWSFHWDYAGVSFRADPAEAQAIATQVRQWIAHPQVAARTPPDLDFK